METSYQSIWLSKAKELYNVTQERLMLEKKEKILSLELRDLSNHEEAQFGGLKFYIETRLGVIDYSGIPELRNVDLNQYRRAPVKVWKLKIETLGVEK